MSSYNAYRQLTGYDRIILISVKESDTDMHCCPNLMTKKFGLYYRVIALILVDIVPSWDIEGRELARVRRYPNEGQYSPVSMR